ncbi:MAG: nucleotidyltransferase family protein [Pseudomonadota bacterium]
MPAVLDIEAVLPELGALCRRFHVRELSLFGSALGPAFRPDSDVDLLVEFEAGVPIGLFELGELRAELEDLFARSVDLVPKRGLKPLIRDEVLGAARVLFAA